MLGRMAGGVAEQRDASMDRGRHAGTTAVVPPSPKLFLADDCGDVSGGLPIVLAEAAVMSLSPTSTLQAAVGSPTTTTPASTAAPFSRHGTSSSSGSDGGCKSSRSHGCHRAAWEAARHAGLGLAGALNAGDDAVPPAATVLRGQSIRSPASLAADRSARTSSLMMMLPARREMVEESEDYTRVITRGGPNPRTTHIFHDVCGGVDDDGESSFLRRCHGCSKDLGQGKDIFMYRGEMAFCSHECRYREMLLFDEES